MAPALFTRTSSRAWLSRNSRATRRTSASDDRSATRYVTCSEPASRLIPAAVARVRSASRPTITTRAPPRARPIAVSLPMPEVAPVIRQILPSMGRKVPFTLPPPDRFVRRAHDGFLLGGRTHHQKLAGPGAGDAPAPRDLRPVAAPQAVMGDRVDPTPGPVIGLREGDDRAGALALERRVQDSAGNPLDRTRLVRGAADTAPRLDQDRDEGGRIVVARVGEEAVPQPRQAQPISRRGLCHQAFRP